MTTYEQRVQELLAQGTEAQRKAFADGRRRQHGHLEHERTWLAQLCELVDGLTAHDEPSWMVVDLFWVRLHELLTRLLKKFSGLGTAGDPGPLSRDVQAVENVRAAIDRVRTSLSNDEAIFIDLYRQRAVHLEQSGFRLRVDKTREKNLAACGESRFAA